MAVRRCTWLPSRRRSGAPPWLALSHVASRQACGLRWRAVLPCSLRGYLLGGAARGVVAKTRTQAVMRGETNAVV